MIWDIIFFRDFDAIYAVDVIFLCDFQYADGCILCIVFGSVFVTFSTMSNIALSFEFVFHGIYIP